MACRIEEEGKLYDLLNYDGPRLLNTLIDKYENIIKEKNKEIEETEEACEYWHKKCKELENGAK